MIIQDINESQVDEKILSRAKDDYNSNSDALIIQTAKLKMCNRSIDSYDFHSSE